MSEQEILEKAIRLAIDNGWKAWGNSDKPFTVGHFLGRTTEPIVKFDESNHYALEEVIFNHSFAKALWGEYPDVEVHLLPELDLNGYEGRTISAYADKTHNYKKWQYHLQQMVIAPNPIKYLERVIGESSV